jgi:hypothetical protein
MPNGTVGLLWQEGWVLLASDATIKPRLDSTQWRLAMLAAALESMRREWPQSAKWPVAFRRVFGWGEAQCAVGSDAGQDRISQNVRFLS